MGILNKLLILNLLVFPLAEVFKLQYGSIAFSLNDLFLFVTVVVWVFDLVKNKQRIQGFLLKPIAIFAVIALISLLVNSYKLDLNSFLVSFLYLIRWVMYAMIYFILISRNKEFINKYKYLLLIPISSILFLGYIQYIFYQSLRNLYYLGWDEHLYRLFSTFLDPNFAGAFLAAGLVFLMYLIFVFYKKKRMRITYVLLMLASLNFFAVYLTYSRSALIMLIVAFSLFLILIKMKKILSLLIFIFILFIFISPKSFQTEGTNLLRITSSEARMDSARSAIGIIKNNLIFGVGFNAYRYAQFDYGRVKDVKWITTHSGAGTDNSYLFILATTGIIGLISYSYLIYKIIKLGFNRLSMNKFAAVLIAVFVGFMVNSLFINSLFYVYFMELIWIFAAITENS